MFGILEEPQDFVKGYDDELVPAAVDHIDSRHVEVVRPLQFRFHQ